MTRNTCEICGKDIVGFTECPHYDYKDFLLEIELGEIVMESNEYIASLESSPYSRYLVEKETLNSTHSGLDDTVSEPNNAYSDESSGVTILQRLAFLNIDIDRMSTPLFLRL